MASISPVGPMVFEDEIHADEYLTDLLSKPEYRSMDVVHARAAKYCKDVRIRNYFINKAKKILANPGKLIAPAGKNTWQPRRPI